MSGNEHTAGEWRWVIHDHSCASLGVGDDPGMGTPLVMSVSPCRSCAERADPKEWKWGRCCTPSEADARMMAASTQMYDALKQVKELLQEHLPFGLDGEICAALNKAEGRA